MRRMFFKIVAAFALAACACFTGTMRAQSLPETVEAIERARVTTRILFITAHPDDEASALLTYLSRGLSADVALITLTRGQGGQNAIGPEQGGKLGLLRTYELLGADAHNGVRQFFSRAPDFGFSKSAEQTMEIWGDVPLQDMVRVIRMFRPQIVINGWGGMHQGHGHHQASGILTPRAVEMAADEKAFPQQLEEGLQTWKVHVILDDRRGENAQGFLVPLDGIMPLWGETYNQWARDSLAFHRSQGVTMFLGSPFFRVPLHLLVEREADGVYFDPAMLSVKLGSLGEKFPAYRDALSSADDSLVGAREAALKLDYPQAAKDMAAAGKQVVETRAQVSKSKDHAATELWWDLEQVDAHIQAALVKVAALRIDARAARSELVAGEGFEVTGDWTYRRNVPIEIVKSDVLLPAGWSAAQELASKDSAQHGATWKVVIPAGAVAPHEPADDVLPWPLPLAQVWLQARLGDYVFTAKEPVVSVHPTSTSVETFLLELVPAVTLTVEPRHVMVPEARAAKPIELLARVRYHGTSPARVTAGVDAPAGWRAESPVPMDFSVPGDLLVRFVLTPPAKPASGAYELKPWARRGPDKSGRGEETFRMSVEPLPSLPTRSWSEPALATVHVLDLKIPETLRIGYIAADNDLIPDALRQLGIRVEMLDEIELAFGDLRRFDAVVVGIRAYELRAGLPRANRRLLDYVQNGGTLVVQYQRDYAWNKILPAPFAAEMPQRTARTTDPSSPVKFLAPENSLLNFPNKITQEDFSGWVQERGLYYWGKFDAHYTPVLATHDPGESDETGALVYARDGKGVYVYTGLSFFRQLPAGVPGAYRLFVNLLSQSRCSPPEK